MVMQLKPTTVSIICMHVKQEDRVIDPAGFIALKKNVELLEVVDVIPGAHGFQTGDIVLSRATGIDVEIDGRIYNIQAIENIIGKVK